MVHRFASVALVITLVCAIGGTSVFASTNNPEMALPAPSTWSQVALQSHYHLRQGVGQTLNARVDRWSHPLTRVVVTPSRCCTPLNADGSVTEKEEPKKALQPDEKLRAGIVKLVADTKAGRKKPSGPSQIQPARSNGLSKGKKIALGVGIGAVVVAVIAVVYVRHHLFDDFKPFAQH